MYRKSLALTLYFFFCSVTTIADAANNKIAIIIDDIGNSQTHQAFGELPSQVAFAILPYTPYAKPIAYSAHRQNREVLAHIPMQAYSNNHLLGKGALTSEMDKYTHQKVLNQALNAVPYAVGINNHMGSQLTEQIPSMQWTMELLYQQGYFFIDSRTTANSVAETSATVTGLPSLRRHIFLDNIRTQDAMEAQFQQAIQHSQQFPYTIMIAHPYPETFAFLSQRLAKADKQYQLVTLSALIPAQQRLTLQRKQAQYQQAKLIVPNNDTKQIQ